MILLKQPVGASVNQIQMFYTFQTARSLDCEADNRCLSHAGSSKALAPLTTVYGGTGQG